MSDSNQLCRFAGILAASSVLPPDYAFNVGLNPDNDNGTHTFYGLSLRTAGTQTVTITDTKFPSATFPARAGCCRTTRRRRR